MTISANASRTLVLAAAPSFALMAAIGAGAAPHAALCAAGAGAGGLPIDSMTAMYLLMSLFHLPPWLTLAFGRPGTRA